MPSKIFRKSKQSSYVHLGVNANGQAWVGSPANQNLVWFDEVTFGANKPGWRQLIASGSDATTTLYGKRTFVKYKPGDFRFERVKEGLLPTSVWIAHMVGDHALSLAPSGANPDAISSTKANNEALAKFNRKVVAVNQALQGIVAVGELAQTLRMIKRPAQGLRTLVNGTRRRLRSFLSRFRRRNVNDRTLPSTAAQGLSELWLEQAFGWRPLLSDIDGACRALAEMNTGQSVLSQAIKSVGEAEANATTGQVGNAISIFHWQERFVTKEHTVVVFRGAVRVLPRNGPGMAGHLLGFDPTQFVPSAWELLPYSFLIDYFTNIGDIIAGWSNMSSNLAWCNRTTIKDLVVNRWTWTDTSYVKAVAPWVNILGVSGSGAMVETVKRTVSRETYTGTFVPEFQFEIPGLGSKKWLNIAALVGARHSDRSWWFGE